MLEHLIHVNTWFHKFDADTAEQQYFRVFAEKSTPTPTTFSMNVKETKEEKGTTNTNTTTKQSLTDEIRSVRKILEENQSKLQNSSTGKNSSENQWEKRIKSIEETNEKILHRLDQLTQRIDQIELKQQSTSKPSTTTTTTTTRASTSGSGSGNKAAVGDDDDDVDLFASEDEEESAQTKERLAQYAAKKAKKEQVIAKSSILLDVKPWDDETDLQQMEKAVRSVQADGLVWGQSKFVPVAFGVKKLQIGCVVEDDKVGTDFLEEKICEFEDYVQSVDIVSFNKI